MSDYVKEKVLRVPLERITVLNPEEFENSLTEVQKGLFDYGTVGKFQFAPTEKHYIDYVLFRSYGEECGDFGRHRALTEKEANKYYSIFKQIAPHINMSDVRLVEFCWYNCCEAPDYYDGLNDDDDFYREV